MQKLFVIIGPSGVGKSTLLKELIDRFDTNVIPVFTERPKRSDSENAPEHRFVSEEEMDEILVQDKVLFFQCAFGLEYRYAVPKIELKPKKLNIMLLRSSFIEPLREHFDNIAVYQVEGSLELATHHATSRGGDLGNRLSRFEQEVAEGRELADEVFVNDGTIDDLVESVSRSIKKHLE